MLNKKYGVWSSAGIEFDNKYEALLHASNNHSGITFSYHDSIFKNFDRMQLGKIPLPQLYKERAQQLRDKYDYLILYYSGGSDSHTILETFLKNNIALDEICVRWPKIMTDDKFYTPNNIDTSSKNVWSEWDYSVVPTLNWIKNYYPSIKINIIDYTPGINEINVDSIFEKSKIHGFRIGTIREGSRSDSELKLLNKGKTVGNIFGVDKPLLRMWQKKQVSMLFTDTTTIVGASSLENPTGGEFFYWTPDMPLLPYEQAYQLFLHYKINKEQRKFLFSLDTGLPIDDRYTGQREISKSVLYKNWDYRFQAGKKATLIGTDMYFWLLDIPELKIQKEKLIDNIIRRTNLINSQLLRAGGTINSTELMVPITLSTPGYYVGDFDD